MVVLLVLHSTRRMVHTILGSQEYCLTRAASNMRLPTYSILLAAVTISVTNAQFFNALRNLFSPVTNLFNGGRFVDDGTQAPQATGREELFPSDCGRDPAQGTGKLCFPDGLLCKDRKYTHRDR